VKNVPESNGKVGMLGSSYEGFTVVMALVNPHPRLLVAAPMSPMVDGWMGDDWFHFGAFRQTNLDYITGQTAAHGEGKPAVRGAYDDYDAFRRAGSAGDFARAAGLDQLPFCHRHPAYDVLAAAGARQDDRRPAIESADDVDSRIVGSGGYVGRHPHTWRLSPRTRQRQELSWARGGTAA
jgi:predicted acyl esterase